MTTDTRIRQELKAVKEQQDISYQTLAKRIGAKEYYLMRFVRGQAKLGYILQKKIMTYFKSIDAELVKQIEEEKSQKEIEKQSEEERKTEMRAISKMLGEEIRRQQRKEALQLERMKKLKPHLINVPQRHTESKYAKYLWESYSFTCAKVAE